MGQTEALAQLDAFAGRYTPAIAELGLTAIARLRAKLPGASVLIYDNYNALAVGFAANDKASTAILSIAFYPHWVTLFLANGATLNDPQGLLQGNGSVMRHIVLGGVDDLDQPAIAMLIDQALDRAKLPIDSNGEGAVIVKSISAKQRPRRPGG